MTVRHDRETTALAALSRSNPQPNDAQAPTAAPALALLRDRILASPLPQHPTRTARPRRALISAVAVAAVLVAVIGSWVLPPGNNAVGPAPAVAAALQRAAAGAAAGPALAGGQYLLTKDTSHELQLITCLRPQDCVHGQPRPGVQADSYTLNRVTRVWTSAAGVGRYLSVSAAPQFTAAELDRFRVSGQPAPTKPATLDEPLNAAPGVFGGDPRGWSLTPAVLTRQIVTRFEGGHADPFATFDLATQLLQTTTLPALKAALYQVLASTPGVAHGGAQTDVAGRRGDAFTMGRDGVRITWLVDTGNGQLLQRSTTLTQPSAALDPATRTLPAGIQLSVETFSTPQIVNTDH